MLHGRRARRPPGQRDQAAATRSAAASVPPSRTRWPSASARPASSARWAREVAGPARRRRGPRRRLRRRRQRARPPPARRASPAATSPSSASTCARVEAGDTRRRRTRSGSSPRSRSATSSSSAPAIPSRSGRPTSTSPGSEQLDLDGLLRDRPGAHRRRGGRAVRRRAGDLLAARARALGRRARRPGQAGHATSASSPSGSTTSCAARGLDVLYDDRDAGPGGEVRRRRAARLPAAGDGGQADARGGRARGPGAPRARDRDACRSRARPRRCAELWRTPPVERPPRPPTASAALSGLDRSGPAAARDAGRARRCNPWTIPNAIGFVRLRADPGVPRASPSASDDGTSAPRRPLRGHRLERLPRRHRRARHGPVQAPRARCWTRSSTACWWSPAWSSCWHFELLPRWALAVLVARELFMLVARALRRCAAASTSRSTGPGALGGVAGARRARSSRMCGVHWLALVLLYVGWCSRCGRPALYVRDGQRNCTSCNAQAELDRDRLRLYSRVRPMPEENCDGHLPRSRLALRPGAQGPHPAAHGRGAGDLLPAAHPARQDRHPARRARQPPAQEARGRRGSHLRRRRPAPDRHPRRRAPPAADE